MACEFLWVKGFVCVGEAVADLSADFLGEAVVYACECGAVDQREQYPVVDALVAEAAHVEVAEAFVDSLGDDDAGGGGSDVACLALQGGGNVRNVEVAADVCGGFVKARELCGFQAVEVGCEDFDDEAVFDKFFCEHDCLFSE